MGSHFASKAEPSSLGLATSKNIRRRRNSRTVNKVAQSATLSFFGDALRARTPERSEVRRFAIFAKQNDGFSRQAKLCVERSETARHTQEILK